MKKLNKMSNEELKTQYENVCNEYVRRFCEKQEIDFDGWVGDEVGGIASFIHQYFFNMSDIILDITTNQPVGFILDWQSDGVDYNMFDYNMFKDKTEYINYNSYIMGLRYYDLKK
jgi:hypothetical protein